LEDTDIKRGQLKGNAEWDRKFVTQEVNHGEEQINGEKAYRGRQTREDIGGAGSGGKQ